MHAKTWFPSNEMQKSPNLTNEPLCTVCHFRIVGTLSDFFLQHSYEKNHKTRIFLHIWRNFKTQKFWSLGTSLKILGA